MRPFHKANENEYHEAIRARMVIFADELMERIPDTLPQIQKLLYLGAVNTFKMLLVRIEGETLERFVSLFKRYANDDNFAAEIRGNVAQFVATLPREPVAAAK